MKTSKRYKICAKMRAGKERKRLETPPPEYPPNLPELRRRITVTNYEFGEDTHVLDLHRSNRIDCFDVYVDGNLWKKRIGWSKILAGIRKSMPRVRVIKC